MVNSLFVPLDGSELAEHALPLALTIARRANARLNLGLVHRPVYTESAAAGFEGQADRAARQHEQSYLESVVARLKRAGQVQVSAALGEGPVVETIRNKALAARANLIVMTTHGRGPLARFWLGSVADRLLRESPVPVLLQRPQQRNVDLAQEIPLRRMLVALDGSPLAERIIEPVATLASLMRAEVYLVRVIEPPERAGIDPTLNPVTLEGKTMLESLKELHDQQYAAASEYLEIVRNGLQGRKLDKVQCRVAVAPHPVVGLQNEVEAQHIELIALATHGRGGLTRMVLGSVADKVIRWATIPILVSSPDGP